MKRKTEQQGVRFRKWRRAGYAIFASLHKQVSIGTLAVGMSAILLNAPVQAKAQSVAQPREEETLDEVAIEAVEVEAGAVMGVESLGDVSHRRVVGPVQNLESVLRTLPGVDIRERGGRGTQTDIMVRGGSADQTLMMLNGINFTDARTGHQSHQLPVDLEAISGLALYTGVPIVGAYAGALDVRTPPDNTLNNKYLRAHLSGGGDGYAYGNLSGALGSPDGRFRAFAAASYRRSDGYRYNTDFENYNAFTRLVWDTKRAGRFDVQGGFQDRAWGSNGFYSVTNPDQWEHTTTGLTSLKWDKRVGGAVTLRAQASYRKNLDRYDWTRGTQMNHHDTDHAGAGVEAEYEWVAGRTTLQVDHTYHHIRSTNLGDNERSLTTVWLGHERHWQRPRIGVKGGGGATVTPYGTSALWNIRGDWSAFRDFNVSISANQSLRLPTFTDLYYTSPAQINNPDLEPERAISYHLDARYRWGRTGSWHASANGFYRNGRNVIDWVWREELEKWRCEQESRLDTYGVEAEIGYRPMHLFFRGFTLSYGYLNTTQMADVVTSSVLDYMRHKASTTVEIGFLQHCTLTLTGSFFDRHGPGFEPYALLDARVAWNRGKWLLYIDGMNITDTKYYDFSGLPLPGAWFSAGVVFTI